MPGLPMSGAGSSYLSQPELTTKQLWKVNDENAQKSGARHKVFTSRAEKMAAHTAALEPTMVVEKRAGKGSFDHKWRQCDYKLGSKMTGPNLKWSPVDNYVGEWEDNVREGEGTFVYQNGSKYSGSWVEDRRTGDGKFWVKVKGQKDLAKRYDGQWYDNQKHGRGQYWFPDGAVYKGEFSTDLREGAGVQDYANGDNYNGQWREGKRSGEGVLKMANGDVYRGEWGNDVKEGKGVYYFKVSGKKLEGQWVEDVLSCGVFSDQVPGFDPQSLSVFDDKYLFRLQDLALEDAEGVVQAQHEIILQERADRNASASGDIEESFTDEQLQHIHNIFMMYAEEGPEGQPTVGVTQLLRVIEDLEGRSRITEDELRSRLTDHYGAEDIRFGWEDLIPFFVEMADEEQ